MTDSQPERTDGTMEEDKNWMRLTSMEKVLYHQTSPDDPMCLVTFFSLSDVLTPEWILANAIPRLVQHNRFASNIVKHSAFSQPRFQLIPSFRENPTQAARPYVTLLDPLPSDRAYNHFCDKLSEIASGLIPIKREQFDDKTTNVSTAPLWRIYVIPGFSFNNATTEQLDQIEAQSNSNHYTTVVLHIHHCISDGIGLVKYLVTKLMDSGDKDTPGRLLVPTKNQRKRKSHRNVSSKPISSNSNNENNDSNNTSQEETDENKSEPLIPPKSSSSYTKTNPITFLSDLTIGLYRYAMKSLIPDPNTALTTDSVRAEYTCAFSRSDKYTISGMKPIAHRLGVTLNDVFFTAVSGAMSRYLKLHSTSSAKIKRIRCAITVNRTMMNYYRPQDVSNNLALLPIPLNASTSLDRTERLQRCVNTMRGVKRGVQVRICLALVSIFSYLPVLILLPLWLHLTRASSGLFSNVPGPKETVRISGVNVDGLNFLGIVGGRVSNAISFLSYNNQLQIGYIADKRLVKDPQSFVTLVEEELDELIKLSEQL